MGAFGSSRGIKNPSSELTKGELSRLDRVFEGITERKPTFIEQLEASERTELDDGPPMS